MKPMSVPPWEGQSHTDKLTHIREQLWDLLDELDADEFYAPTARMDAILEHVDALQLLSFREDPPAFLTRSVK